jgi:hypothetical protein
MGDPFNGLSSQDPTGQLTWPQCVDGDVATRCETGVQATSPSLSLFFKSARLVQVQVQTPHDCCEVRSAPVAHPAGLTLLSVAALRRFPCTLPCPPMPPTRHSPVASERAAGHTAQLTRFLAHNPPRRPA